MLITAFAKTGKDTFFQDLQCKTIRLVAVYEDDTKSEIKWNVYAKKKSAIDLLLAFEQIELQKRAFANALKQEVHDYLHLKHVGTNSFEYVKDSCLFQDPSNPTVYRTMRGWYIFVGSEKRKIDPLYWAKQVYNEVLPDSIARIITDWRMENEFVPNQITVRLFRSTVPVPTFPSEHELDKWPTDFLLMSPGDEMQACKQFPQYTSYQLIGYYVYNKGR